MMRDFAVKSKDFKSDWIETPLGTMLAVADDEALYLLEFADHCMVEKEVEKLQKKIKSTVTPGKTQITNSIRKELKSYFLGQLEHFLTPIEITGTVFQKKIWLELMKIPVGQTRSYSDVAKAIGNFRAVRAIGGASGANQLAIIIPCHRVININGEMGGYFGGLTRKKYLLEHEKKYGKRSL